MKDSLNTSTAPSGQLSKRLDALKGRISELQSGRSGRFVLFSHDPTGLGGQIARRLLAVRVGLLTRRTAVFLEEDFYPYENAFEPLSTALDISDDVPEFQTEMSADVAPVVKFNFWKFWADEIFKAKVYGYIPAELANEKHPGILLDGAIFDTFRLKPEYEETISSSLIHIDSLKPVIGVHFRRGDKSVETPYVTAQDYRSAIEMIAAASQIRNVFISSDSPDAVKELNLDPSRFQIFFDHDEKRYNNANHKFLMRNRHLAKQETVTAIRNIYTLARCTAVVGQSNAHFAHLAAGSIAARNEDAEYGLLIEPATVPENWAKRQLYRARQKLRSAAKLLLPRHTLKHRARSATRGKK
jgi:hypothetical protein